MIIGIDPGLTGAIACLEDDLTFISVFDMPVMALTKGRNQVNASQLAKIISAIKTQNKKVIVYLEKVQAMPGQGVSSMFSFGQSFGIILGVVATLELPLVLVTPLFWKKNAGLIHTEKDKARTLAQQLYPEAPLGKKGDIGKADAILIARFGR